MENAEFKSIYEGEYMISELIKGDNGCYTHFNYDSVYSGDANTSLQLVTYNPVHKTHFLLHQLDGVSELDALQKMYDHIYNIKELLQKKDNVRYASYTVQWWEVDKTGVNHSHFYGQSIEEVMKKFYYNKRRESYTILSVRLNAES